MLRYMYLLITIGFDTAESEPSRVCYLLICSSPDLGLQLTHNRFLIYRPVLEQNGVRTRALQGCRVENPLKVCENPSLKLCSISRAVLSHLLNT